MARILRELKASHFSMAIKDRLHELIDPLRELLAANSGVDEFGAGVHRRRVGPEGR